MRRVATLLFMIVAASAPSVLAQDPPTVTETQKFTSSTAGSMIGDRLSCQGMRCAAELPSQTTRLLTWSSPTGWTNPSSSSSHFNSVGESQIAHVLSTTAVSTRVWEDGSSTPDNSTIEYILTADAEVLALSGDRLAVSRRSAATVEMYKRNLDGTWSLGNTFSGLVTERFGHDVDLDGDTLVIGVPFESWGATTGRVHVYADFDSGPPTLQQLSAPEGETGNTFGASVAIWGDWLAVGAPTEDTAFPQPWATDVGAVYLYERGSSGFEYRSTIFGEVSGDQHGSDVDFQGVTIVAGAPLADVDGKVDAGLATVYRVQGGLWSSVARLLASDAEAGDKFGTSVAISAPGVLVGAPFSDGISDASNAGGIYYYEWLGTAVFMDGFETGGTTAWSYTAG